MKKENFDPELIARIEKDYCSKPAKDLSKAKTEYDLDWRKRMWDAMVSSGAIDSDSEFDPTEDFKVET